MLHVIWYEISLNEVSSTWSPLILGVCVSRRYGTARKKKKREKGDTGVSSFHNSSKDRFFFQFCFSDFIWRSLIGKFCRNFTRKIYFYLQWLGRILVSSFLICHFLYLCAIRAWRTFFLIPVWLLFWCYFQQLLLLSHRAAPVQLKTISVNCSKHLNHFIILPTVDATR